jgi:hypothetical protein
VATQPHIQCVLGAPFPSGTADGREVNHSPPFTSEVKNAWSYTYTPPYFLAWYLIKYMMRFLGMVPR